MKCAHCLAVTMAVMVLAAASPAASQVALRFDPLAQHVALGASGSLSVMLDAGIEVRTIEMWVSYDPTVVTSLGGQPGQIFTESGCPLFPVFDEDTPGSFYAGAVTLGSTCFATGPGELYRWNFEGLADGICVVRVDSLVLYDPFAEVIAGVSLSGTTILVGTVSSAGPPPARGLTLALSPNPFNPRTTIRFGGRTDEDVTVEVFDVNGRLLDTLWRGSLGPHPETVDWDGLDGQGRAVSSGTYLFRIQGRGGLQTTRKGVLVR